MTTSKKIGLKKIKQLLRDLKQNRELKTLEKVTLDLNEVMENVLQHLEEQINDFVLSTEHNRQ
jgi:DNA-binding transcriptional MerR regulator